MGWLGINRKYLENLWIQREESVDRVKNDNIFTFELNGDLAGIQGLTDDQVILNFDNSSTLLRFEDVIGGTISALDDNIDEVVDTGEAITFNFSGGGSITLLGISGYTDFAALSMDYTIEVFS